MAVEAGQAAAWTRALRVDDVPAGRPKVFRSGGRQIVIFRLDGERIFAVDNRCPHEGYPLVQGYVKDCVLTCAWHNWKFDLRDGACLIGEEDVSHYPVRVSGEWIEVDLSDSNRGEDLPRRFESLETGLHENQMGRVARDVTRLLQAGVAPREIALRAALWDAKHGQYGPSHALPVATDALRYLPRYTGADAALPLMQAMDMASRANVRRPPRPTAEAADPGDDPAAAGARLQKLVEDEEVDAAEGLIRGAIRKGWGRDVVEPWLYRLCADHFLDFGHALIYQVKVFDLLDAVGWDRAEDLLAAHLAGIANGTREDTLPPWDSYRGSLASLEPRFEELLVQQKGGTPSIADAGVDASHFLGSLLDGKWKDAFGVVVGALEAGLHLETIVDLLSLAASIRMLRFNVAVDRDITVQEGWLDVTHILTFANALRHTVRRYREPEVLRLVFQSARFVNKAKPLDSPVRDRTTIALGDAGSVLDAVLEKDARRALGRAAVLFEPGEIPEEFENAAMDLTLKDPAVRPIVVAHVVKTTVAAFEESRFIGERAAETGLGRLGRDAFDADLLADDGVHAAHLPVYALLRFLASPVSERRIGQAAHEAIRFVVQGKVPRTLTD